MLAAMLALSLAAGVACAQATGAEADKQPAVDPTPCFAAITAGADEKIVADCGALIDNDKTARVDRIRALAARSRVFVRQDQRERAIADYGALLRLDPTADNFNARGELYWKMGNRPSAVADFSAALKLDPNHATAKDNYRRLALELERLGAMMALRGKPSFNCAAARLAVEKAICSNPDLADLDREISMANAKLVHAASAAAQRDLARQQQDFVATRNAAFGKPGYDLQKAMRERLEQLQALDH